LDRVLFYKNKDVLLHTDQTGTVISFVLGRGWNDEEILALRCFVWVTELGSVATR
jgi:hypothetical protein